ncbi:hypothetical protein [Streptomyces sp. NPDC046909]|uniref:hypothetical protein n=1 Tax=Streptomyces sp. NPDC046909 TaxID=3155617 RepID=UPI0033F7E396
MNDTPAEKQCFYIAPIGMPGSDIRLRSDQILRHVVRPAVESCGYSATRGDQIDGSGLITTQVLQRIFDDDLIIADLTDNNPNVYYELAVRHALRKPFIHIVQTGQPVPFDVQGIRVIELDHRDLDSAAEARDAIVKAIKAIEDKKPLDTPMTYALDLQQLRGSDKAEERGIADILEAVQEMQRHFTGPRTTADSRAVREARELKEFINWLASRGRIDREDLAALVANADGMVSASWLRSLSHTITPDEPLPLPRLRGPEQD